MKSSLCRSCFRDLIWVESVWIINLSWHRSWEEAAQASVMGLSVWGVDRLHWKQKMKPYKSVIVTPVLTGRELPACIWVSLPAYRCNFYAVFSLQCGSLGTQARVVGLGSLKKKMKRYLLWKTFSLESSYYELHCPSSGENVAALCRYKFHQPILSRSIRWWGWIVAEFKVLTSSKGPARPLPSLSKVCILARKKGSSYFIGLIMIRYRAQMRQTETNRGNRGIDMIRCNSDDHSAKLSLYKRLHQWAPQ